MANLSTACTANSITVYVENLDTSYNSSVTRTCVTTLSSGGTTVATQSSGIANQVSSATVATFSGLDPYTSYSISCTITYNTGSVTLTTTATTEHVTTAIQTEAVYIGEQYITVQSYLTARWASTYYVVYKVVETGETYTSSSTTFSSNDSSGYLARTNIYNLTGGNTYTINAVLYGSAGQTTITDTIYVTTLTPVTTSITANPRCVDDYTIKVSFSVVAKEAGTYSIAYGVSELGVSTATSTFTLEARGEYTTSEATFDQDKGVKPGKTYTIWCVLYKDGSALDVEDEVTIQTTGEPEIEQWSWFISNGPEYCATADDTERAYDAITNQGALTDFSHLVWNDLVYKTNQMVEDWDDSWDTTFGSLSATLMTSDYTMTAARFNAVWYNIERYASTGIDSAMIAGESKVLGSYFTALVSGLNNAIGVG